MAHSPRYWLTRAVQKKAARDALLSIATHCRSAKVLRPAMLHTHVRTEKSGAVRQCCIEFVVTALKQWPLKLLAPMEDGLYDAVEAAVSDQDTAGPNRALGRQALVLFWRHWRTQGDVLLRSITDAEQERLCKEFPELKSGAVPAAVVHGAAAAGNLEPVTTPRSLLFV